MRPIVRPAEGAAVGRMAAGRGLRHLRMALWDDGGVRAVRGATRGAASGNRDLDSTPSVGKSARRGIFRQGKVWIRSHTVCMARSRTAAMAEKARREPQTYGRGEVPTRKKSSKTFIVFIYDTGGGTDTPAHR